LLLSLKLVQDVLMLAAMDGRPFVTMGSAYREIDYERVWSNHLNKLAKKSKTSADTGNALRWWQPELPAPSVHGRCTCWKERLTPAACVQWHAVQ
jgi:hypothetical protein